MSEKKIGFDEWFKLICQSYLTPPVIHKGEVLPAFPSDTVQENTTGQSGLATLQESFIFYKDCINTFEELARPVAEDDRILDFGIGWGRIARFFLRELPISNIHGVDVTPEFIDICKNLFQSDNFFNCQPRPPTKLLDHYYDFIVGYSVFSHLSEDTCMAWMKEFERILKPGGILAITTRGRPFFDFCESQRKTVNKALLQNSPVENKPPSYLEALGQLFENFDDARAQYDRGEFVHSNIQEVGGGGALNPTFYGETFIPESYARRAYNPILKMEKFVFDPNRQSHPIMFFRKNN